MAPIALDLLQVATLVAQQAAVALVPWQHVGHTPEASPAQELGPEHEPGQQASGGADLHGSDCRDA